MSRWKIKGTSKIEQDFDLVASNLEEFLAPAALGLANYPSSYLLEVRQNGNVSTIEVDILDFDYETMDERRLLLDPF